MKDLIGVEWSGAVHLGPDVCCDGFVAEKEIRVQTHLHADHLDNFNTSKGMQEIIMTEPTYDILCMEENADIPYRSNVSTLNKCEQFVVGKSRIKLIQSGHTLGGAQVLVELDNGTRLGYSSDFAWPLDNVPSLDALVVDSTYGSRESIRNYTQGECERRFVSLLNSLLQDGPVHLISHRGTLQRALQILSGEIDVPIFGSKNVVDRANIYRKYGYVIKEIKPVSRTEKDKYDKYVRVYGTGDKSPVDNVQGSKVKTSAFFSTPDDPIMEYSPRSFGVALSDHADFDGTLEYVERSNANFVVTDNSRGGNAVELAEEIRNRLGVEAKASSSIHSYSWSR